MGCSRVFHSMPEGGEALGGAPSVFIFQGGVGGGMVQD